MDDTDASTPAAVPSRVWRVVGIGFVLVGLTLVGIVAGWWVFSTRQDDRVDSLTNTVTSTRARIAQLEDELERNNLPVPPPPTTSTVAPDRPRSTSTTGSTVTTTTTSTSSTSSPRRPCTVSIPAICIGGEM